MIHSRYVITYIDESLFHFNHSFMETGLQHELNQLTATVAAGASPEVLQVLQRFTGELKTKDYQARSLQVGDMAEDFVLEDTRGQLVSLYALLAAGPVVLSFYRGGWCPYCNMELTALRYALAEIELSGAQLIAISPEKPDNMRRTISKNKLDFKVLSDVNSSVARSFGLAFTLPDYMTAFYRSFGLNLSRYNADVTARLPLPATYIIDTQYTVRYAFVEACYTQRAEPGEIVATLQSLQHSAVMSCG